MSTDYREIYWPDLPITSAAAATHPLPRRLPLVGQVVHWLVPLGRGRWDARWGKRAYPDWDG
ncbi:MAG: hypothetical protein GY832_05660 [Chloroflexi bacterium]|nr:hypothetical protein [Chloroflexota bacterium]